jgi:hypothetical protein
MTKQTKSETVNVAFSLENVDPNSYEINFMHPESDSTERCVFFLDPCVTINNIALEEGRLAGTGIIGRHNVPVFAPMKDALNLKSLKS